MRAHWVDVHHDFASPVARVFAHLAEHENLAALFGAGVQRLADGDDERNGVGSRRQLKVGPLPPFEETVTEFVPDELIVYRITKGSPLKGHEGTMRFSADGGGGSHLHYRIRLASPIPGVALAVREQLTRTIRANLPRVDAAVRPV
jgi:uncharacterized protein YndB with AHSA1/START domain